MLLNNGHSVYMSNEYSGGKRLYFPPTQFLISKLLMLITYKLWNILYDYFFKSYFTLDNKKINFFKIKQNKILITD